MLYVHAWSEHSFTSKVYSMPTACSTPLPKIDDCLTKYFKKEFHISYLKVFLLTMILMRISRAHSLTHTHTHTYIYRESLSSASALVFFLMTCF